MSVTRSGAGVRQGHRRGGLAAVLVTVEVEHQQSRPKRPVRHQTGERDLGAGGEHQRVVAAVLLDGEVVCGAPGLRRAGDGTDVGDGDFIL